ncbi:MAG: hypothetical protein JXQ96_22750 [Cyclobacteriaceae bacterium]
MKKIRSIMIGMIFGGGLGANFGVFLASLINQITPWISMEIGLFFGIAIGGGTSMLLLYMSSNTKIVKSEMRYTSRRHNPSNEYSNDERGLVA